MRFSVGERVVFIEDGTEAEVIAIISSKIVEVLTEYGKEATVLTKDLSSPKEQEIIQSKRVLEARPAGLPQPIASQELPKGFYFSFRPHYISKREEIDTINIALINRTKASVIVEFSATINNEVYVSQKLIVRNLSEAGLAEIPFGSMTGKPKLNYLICPVAGTTDWGAGDWFQLRGSIGLSPKKLFTFIQNMEAAEKDSFEIFLDDVKERQVRPIKDVLPPSKAKQKREPEPEIKKKSRKSGSSFSEIDLHTESLHIPVERLDHFGILSRQLQALEKAIDQALSRGQTSLVIIHGVGTGKLKEEVHQLLKGHPQVTFFQYSWRPQYGWGATEAFFK